MSMFTCCTQPTSWVSQLSVKGHALPAPATKGAIGIHNISTPIYRFLIDKFWKWFYLFLFFLVVSGYSGCFVLPEGLRLLSDKIHVPRGCHISHQPHRQSNLVTSWHTAVTGDGKTQAGRDESRAVSSSKLLPGDTHNASAHTITNVHSIHIPYIK